MLRWDTILDTTSQAGYSCRLSLFSTDQQPNDPWAINGRSIISNRQRRWGRGELKIKTQFQTHPSCTSCALFSSNHGLERPMASKLLCCLDADWVVRERGKADKKIKFGSVFKLLEWGKLKPYGLFPPHVWFAIDWAIHPPNRIWESRFVKSPNPPWSIISNCWWYWGRGKLKIKKSISNPTPCAHLVHSSLLIMDQRCIWLWSYFEYPASTEVRLSPVSCSQQTRTRFQPVTSPPSWFERDRGPSIVSILTIGSSIINQNDYLQPSPYAAIGPRLLAKLKRLNHPLVLLNLSSLPVNWSNTCISISPLATPTKIAQTTNGVNTTTKTTKWCASDWPSMTFVRVSSTGPFPWRSVTQLPLPVLISHLPQRYQLAPCQQLFFIFQMEPQQQQPWSTSCTTICGNLCAVSTSSHHSSATLSSVPSKWSKPATWQSMMTRRSISMIPRPPKSQYWQTQSSKTGNAHGPNCAVFPLLTTSAMKTWTPSSLIIRTSMTVWTCSTRWDLPPPHGSTSTPSCYRPLAGSTSTTCTNYPALNQQSDTYMRRQDFWWKRHGSKQSNGAISILGPWSTSCMLHAISPSLKRCKRDTCSGNNRVYTPLKQKHCMYCPALPPHPHMKAKKGYIYLHLWA